MIDKRLTALDDKERLLATLKESVEDIIEIVDKLNLDALDSVNFLGVLYYADALKIIQENCSEEDRKAIGLDFDIHERFAI